jgi:predicted nucleic acid-binding protein
LAADFFDTSALVKRYAEEIGSAWVQQLADPASKAAIYLARITEVEVTSAITRRLRQGSLSAAEASSGLSSFHYDVLRQYQIVEISPSVTRRAASLVRAYALRAYDAVQLAAALELSAERVMLGSRPVQLISADAALNAAAAAEGLAADDPNAHA